MATAERWSIIRDVAKQRRAEGYTPVIVCSALSGVSNQLDTLLTAALENKHEEHLETLLNTHLDLARNLGIDSGWLTDAFEPLRRVARWRCADRRSDASYEGQRHVDGRAFVYTDGRFISPEKWC